MYMHNNTLIFTWIVVFESKTWSVFKEISLETLPKLYKIVKFWCIFPKFQKIPGQK